MKIYREIALYRATANNNKKRISTLNFRQNETVRPLASSSISSVLSATATATSPPPINSTHQYTYKHCRKFCLYEIYTYSFTFYLRIRSIITVHISSMLWHCHRHRLVHGVLLLLWWHCLDLLLLSLSPSPSSSTCVSLFFSVVFLVAATVAARCVSNCVCVCLFFHFEGKNN